MFEAIVPGFDGFGGEPVEEVGQPIQVLLILLIKDFDQQEIFGYIFFIVIR